MPPSPLAPRILLAEDDDLVRTVAEETLTDAGYAVVSVANGADALAALPRVRPHLIVSDVRMPCCDGLELLRRVRRDLTFDQTPFIILSAKADTADQRRGMSLGADDYLTKPYQPEDLLKTVEIRLARRSAIKERLFLQQDLFVRVLPHELRTPLTEVIECADLLMQAGLTGETMSAGELVGHGQDLMRSAQRMLRLTEDLSLWAWLESQAEVSRGDQALPRLAQWLTPALIGALCREAEKEFGREGEIRVRLAAAAVSVVPEGLNRVVRHLVDNALEFSSPRSRIEVIGRTNRHLYDLTVCDHGRGMTTDQIRRIEALGKFEREHFVQQGLELAIAARFAALSGGSLELNAQPTGPGLQVRLSLPLAAVETPPSPRSSHEFKF